MQSPAVSERSQPISILASLMLTQRCPLPHLRVEAHLAVSLLVCLCRLQPVVQVGEASAEAREAGVLRKETSLYRRQAPVRSHSHHRRLLQQFLSQPAWFWCCRERLPCTPDFT